MQDMQEMQVPSLGQEDPLEEEVSTHSSILAWETHGQRSLVGYSPWDRRELDMTEQLKKLHFTGLLQMSAGSAWPTVYTQHFVSSLPFPNTPICQLSTKGL